MDQSNFFAVDRSFLMVPTGASILVVCLIAAPVRAAPSPCQWNDVQLRQVVEALVVLPVIENIDSIPAEQFHQLIQRKADNFACLEEVFRRGLDVVPGLAAEYKAALSKRPLQEQAALTARLVSRRYALLPALTYLEPIRGRDFAEAELVRKNLRAADLAFFAEEIWPRRSRLVRDRLRAALAKAPADPALNYRLLFQLLRFAHPVDFPFVGARIARLPPDQRKNVEHRLTARRGKVADLLTLIASGDQTRGYGFAVDALIAWGYIGSLCDVLRTTTDPTIVTGVMGAYDAAKQGTGWETFPDDVIATIRVAPGVWLCASESMPVPERFRKDRPRLEFASTWSRPPLGGDSP